MNKLKETKVLLINPPLTGYLDAFFSVTEPLGLAYIAAMLEKNGFNVRILDAVAEGYKEYLYFEDGLVRVGLSDENIRGVLLNFSPDIIGIGCMFTVYFKDSLRIAKLCKEGCPNATIVLGGAHATVDPESVLENNNFVDLVVIGEGELTFLELVEKTEAKKEFLQIPGIAFKDNGRVKINQPRKLIENLDDLPLPARHLLPMQKYFEYQRQTPKFDYYKRKPVAQIITSRGCPNNCVFCSVKTICGRGWRGRSSENILKEIRLLVSKYGVKEISFMDDNMNANKRRMLSFVKDLIKEKIDITWCARNGIFIMSLDKELLFFMKKSGYYQATFGIESGDRDTLKFIRKPIDFEKVKEVIRFCDELGIWTHSTFIIGFPYEKIDSIQKTLNMPIELGLDFISFYIAQPFPGTDLFEIFEKEGLIPVGIQRGSSYLRTKYNTKYFSAEELMKIRKQAYKRFVKTRILRSFYPSNIIKLKKKISSLEDFKFFLFLVKNIVSGKWSGTHHKKWIGNW